MKRVLLISVILAAMLVTACGAPSETEQPSVTMYTLSTSISPSGAGSVSPSDGQYEEGSQVTLTATHASGYTFDSWNGDASGSSTTITITMDSDKSLTAHFKVLEAEPAAFSLDNLYIRPAEAQSREVVIITALVTNTGGSEGSHTVVLNINDAEEDKISVTLGAGESKKVSFSVSREEPGSYAVTVDDLSDSFTVASGSLATDSGVQIKVSGTTGLQFSGSYMVMTFGGQVTSKSVDGTVPSQYSVAGTMVSAVFQKQTKSGTLMVEILRNGRVLSSSDTTAAYGVVSVATNI